MDGLTAIAPFIPLLIFVLFLYLFFLRKIPTYMKYKKTIESIVKYGANDENTQELIDFFQKVGIITNRPSYWDSARANFELVNQSDQVSRELKQELRNTLLGLGVSRLQAIRTFDKK